MLAKVYAECIISYLCRRILVAFHLAERVVSSIKYELRRVVTEETLSHVHDRLDGRCLRGFVNDRPDTLSAILLTEYGSTAISEVWLTKHLVFGQQPWLQA